MRKVSKQEATSILGGWTCWACGAKGQSNATRMRHAQVYTLHAFMMTY